MMTMNHRAELSNEQVARIAPSSIATAPHHEVSDKYSFVPTMRVVDIMRNEGWYPVHAKEAGTRVDHREGFQKHVIRFAHQSLTPNMRKVGDEMVEAVMVNSHDRSCAFQFYIGIFRLVCSNGMISAVGDFGRVSVKHIHAKPTEIIGASQKVLEHAPAVMESMNEMKDVPMLRPEKEAFATATMNLLFDEPSEAPFKAERLLRPRRYRDRENSDLWTTFNTVQENVMKGGIRGWNSKTRRHVSSRPIKSIDRDVKLNKALWTLAEEMKAIKLAA